MRFFGGGRSAIGPLCRGLDTPRGARYLPAADTRAPLFSRLHHRTGVVNHG